MRHIRNIVLRPCLPLAFLLAAAACSQADDDGSSSAQASSTQAFTVEGGDKFVVSAASDHVVLEKRVGDIVFPFTKETLLGKAILIHPVGGRAADGVYSRATSIDETSQRLDIQATPLTLAEMASIAEDDIVRIYIPKSAASVAPQGLHVLDSTTQPTGVTTSHSIGIDGLDLNGFLGITAAKVGLGVTVKHRIDKAEFHPEILYGYSAERGLELGARASFSWQSHLTISGTVNQEFFHSASLETPPLRVALWIGWVPVPLTIKASAYVSCLAGFAGPADVTMTIKADANVGGSLRIDPNAEDLVQSGAFEPTASMTGGVSFDDVQPKLNGTIACGVPRVDIKALVAGLAGPVVSIVPNVTLTDDGPGFELALYAGFAKNDNTLPAAVKLVSYKP